MQQRGSPHRVVFVYSSRESLWPGLAPYLAAGRGVFRDSLRRCDEEIRRHLGWSLIDRLPQLVDKSALLAAEPVLEPALTALQVALTDAWGDRGVLPGATAGRSAGEFAAGYGCGALSLSEAMELACRISRMFAEDRCTGRVLYLSSAPHEVGGLQADAPAPFHLVADDGPASVYVACEPTAVDDLLAFFGSRGLASRVEAISAAAHSPIMDAFATDFLQPLAPGRRTFTPRVPAYSCVRAAPVIDQLADHRHWWEATRLQVDVRRMFDRLLADGHTVFVEVGGRPSFASIVTAAAEAAGRTAVVLPSMAVNVDIGTVMSESESRLTSLGLVERDLGSRLA